MKQAILLSILALIVITPNTSCTRYSSCICYKSGVVDTHLYFTNVSLSDTRDKCNAYKNQAQMDSCSAYMEQRK